MVRIAVAEQVASLATNASLLADKQCQCHDQIRNIEDLLMKDTNLDSAAYQACFAYITTIKIPVLMQMTLFADALQKDSTNDISKLSALPAGLGGTLDTDVIETNIAQLWQQVNDLSVWKEQYATASSDTQGLIDTLQSNKLQMIRSLEDKRDAALRYAGDTTIYSSSEAEHQRTKSALASLREVFFNSATGLFDMSGITDLSWYSDSSRMFWQLHNQYLLDRYFSVTDENGVLSFEPAQRLVGLVEKLARLALENFSDISEIWEQFSSEEKFVLLYLVANYPSDILSAQMGFAATVGGGAQAVNGEVRLYTGFDFLAGLGDALNSLLGRYGDFGIWTNYLAHMPGNGGITSSDTAGTLQFGAGFMDMYDVACSMLGMDVDTHVVVFQSGGQEYRIQVWDGSYMAGLLFGGEFGIYVRDISSPNYQQYIPGQPLEPEELRKQIMSLNTSQVESYFINYQCVPEGQQFPMILEVYSNSGELLIRNDTRRYAENEDHYWNYFAKPSFDGSTYSGDDLYTVTKVIIDDPTFKEDMRAALTDEGYSVKNYIDPSTGEEGLTIDWGK